MADSFTVPSENNPSLWQALLTVVSFLAPAIYCRSWAPWWRIVITVVVVVVIIVGVPLVGRLLPVPTM